MTDPTERPSISETPGIDTTPAADRLAEVYPLPDELRVVPESVAIDIAVTIAAGRFEDVSELDVLTPEQGGDALNAHRLLLVLLDNSSIEHETIAKELDYHSVAEVLGAIRLARNAVDVRLKTRFEIAQVRYKRELDAWLEGQRLLEEQRLFESARLDNAAAWEMLHLRYETAVFEAVHRLGEDAPHEAVDEAYRIFEQQVREADPDTLLSFGKTLDAALKDGLEAYVAEHAAAAEQEKRQRQAEEELRTLDVKTYRRELKKFEASLDDDPAESSLDPAVVKQLVKGALEYLGQRLSGELPPPVKHYDAEHPKANADARRIRSTFKQTVKNRLHVSALMQERGVKGFNLSHLSGEQFQKFLAATLDEAADAAYSRHGKKK